MSDKGSDLALEAIGKRGVAGAAVMYGERDHMG